MDRVIGLRDAVVSESHLKWALPNRKLLVLVALKGLLNAFL